MKKIILTLGTSCLLLVACGEAESTVEKTTEAILELTDEQLEEVSTMEAENEILEENLEAIKTENAALEELLNEL